MDALLQMMARVYETPITWGLVFEISASAMTIVGAILLSAKHRLAPWAFVLWLAANAVWIAFAVINQHWFLALQNVVLSGTSSIGIWVWLIKPALEKNPSWLALFWPFLTPEANQ